MLKKSHFDRLTLFRRQIGQYISHTRCLIVLLSGVRGALDGGCIGRGGGCLFSGGDHDSWTSASRPQSIDDSASRQQPGPTEDASLTWLVTSSTRPDLE